MYYLFIALIGAERLVELVVSRRNATWSFARGGREFGRSHYPVMVGMHAALLLSLPVYSIHYLYHLKPASRRPRVDYGPPSGCRGPEGVGHGR